MEKEQPITAKSVHLSASAGSGKTRALRDRYLALLDELERRGLGLDQAVAITFTDKAAAEIKERVLRGLPEVVLKKIIRGSQDLRISTIHSFCMNLLKRYPLEAGLPPDFGVLDARDQVSKVQRAIEDALEESDRDPAVMASLGDFTVDDLFAAVGFLLSIRSRLKRMEIDAGGPDGLLASLRRGMAVEETLAALRSLISGPVWKDSFRKMELLLRSQGDLYDENKGREHLLLADATVPDKAFRLSSALAPLYFTGEGNPRKNPSIPKKAFSGRNRAEYEAVFFSVQELLGHIRSFSDRARAGAGAAGMLRLFQRAEEKYQEAKLREGLVDFDDLEVYAYRLLQAVESPDILYWLDRKILHFLVDEFQDTSDIQWAILNKLTEELFAGQGAPKPMSATLFVVGDEKQSIYRFREANYRLIEDMRQKMELNLPPGSREILTLDKNYRSAQAVVETVNRVFSTLWGQGYTKSRAERKEHKGSVRLVELLPAGAADRDAGATEAEVLAREIGSFIGRGTTVYEKALTAARGGSGNGEWEERTADYGDCAVLIQSRTRLKEYETALQVRNIPYRVIGGIGFYEEDEVQALMNVLFFLWNRDDRFALAAALKSPLFGLSDRDLFELHGQNGDIAAALAERHPAAAKQFARWGGLAGFAPLSVLLHEIVEESGAYVRFGRARPQAIFNIDKLLDTAREFDRRGYATLQDFVEWVRNIRETEQREATADMNLPGFRGSVSILTVHKAKGLEFPIVFLPGMNQQPKSLFTGPRVVIEDKAGRVRMTVKNDASPTYDELWEREREELLSEHQRLLYVAMTRARDHLVMLGSWNDGKTPVKADTWLEFLHRAVPVAEQESRETKTGTIVSSYPDWQAGAYSPQTEVSPHPSAEAGAKAFSLDVNAVRENLRPVPRSETPEWRKATDFIDYEKEGLAELLKSAQKTGAVSPLTRGSLLHRCLEEWTAAGTYDVDRIMAEFPDLRKLDPATGVLFVSDVKSVLAAVLADRGLAWIFDRSQQAYSELPFLYKRGNSLVSGMIDRLVIRGDRGDVVDYKAILIADERSLEAWIEHYRPQLQVYCEAVQQLFGLRDVRGHLLFLDSVMLKQTTKV